MLSKEKKADKNCGFNCFKQHTTLSNAIDYIRRNISNSLKKKKDSKRKRLYLFIFQALKYSTELNNFIPKGLTLFK